MNADLIDFFEKSGNKPCVLNVEKYDPTFKAIDEEDKIWNSEYKTKASSTPNFSN
jgi:hypothetical protein